MDQEWKDASRASLVGMDGSRLLTAIFLTLLGMGSAMLSYGFLCILLIHQKRLVTSAEPWLISLAAGWAALEIGAMARGRDFLLRTGLATVCLTVGIVALGVPCILWGEWARTTVLVPFSEIVDVLVVGALFAVFGLCAGRRGGSNRASAVSGAWLAGVVLAFSVGVQSICSFDALVGGMVGCAGFTSSLGLHFLGTGSCAAALVLLLGPGVRASLLERRLIRSCLGLLPGAAATVLVVILGFEVVSTLPFPAGAEDSLLGIMHPLWMIAILICVLVLAGRPITWLVSRSCGVVWRVERLLLALALVGAGLETMNAGRKYLVLGMHVTPADLVEALAGLWLFVGCAAIIWLEGYAKFPRKLDSVRVLGRNQESRLGRGLQAVTVGFFGLGGVATFGVALGGMGVLFGSMVKLCGGVLGGGSILYSVYAVVSIVVSRENRCVANGKQPGE